MNSEKKERLAELIEKRIGGALSEAEHAELEAELLQSAESRRLYLDLASQHAHLQSLGDRLAVDALQSTKGRGFGRLAWSLAAAIPVVAGLLLWGLGSDQTVARLVSSENASWESALPTAPGSDLGRGILNLKSGVATVRFARGAEVTLEAPASLALETPMRGRLIAGSAVVDVPESAIGFVIETASSYAVDHGTQFAVSVDEEGNRSYFEVLSGEISVHHGRSSEEFRLKDGEMVVADVSGIAMQKRRLESGSLPVQNAALRFESAGREANAVRSDDFSLLHPHFLMAKRTDSLDEFDRRSVFGFRLQNTDWLDVRTARIRLNLVPCGLGFAARLPAKSRFAIYGVPGEVSLNDNGSFIPWQDLPQPEEQTLLGRFELSRGEASSSVVLETEALVSFLQSHPSGDVNFLLIRETDEDQLGGLVHAFASSSHPTVSGPSLEINY